MLNGQKKHKPRNFVQAAMVRLAKRSVAHGKVTKAQRRSDTVELLRADMAY